MNVGTAVALLFVGYVCGFLTFAALDAYSRHLSNRP